MRVFQSNSEGTTYVSDPTPKSENLILKVVKTISVSAVVIVSLIYCGVYALIVAGFLVFLKIILKAME